MKMNRVIGRGTRCKHKCPNSKTKTKISIETMPVAVLVRIMVRRAGLMMVKGDRGRIHFSKCNNNQLFRGGRISLKGRDSSTTKPTTPWTSKTKPIHPNHQTHLHQTHVMGVVLRRRSKRILILVIIQTQYAPLAQ